MTDAYSKFGVTLKRLSSESIETVRLWRNSEDVRPFMQYQEMITVEEQIKWFDTINNEHNYYFITYRNDIAFGVFNIKDINYHTKTGETGSFLKDRSFWDSDWSIRASYTLASFGFEELNLERLFCHVLKDNKQAINFNKHQGLKIDESYLSDKIVKLTLSKKDFYEKNKKLMAYLNKHI